MDLFDTYPIFYKEVDTISSHGAGNTVTILRLDGPNFGLLLSGWCNGSKILIKSCYEFEGWRDIVGLEYIKDHYENGKEWIESEIVNEEYFNLAITSLVDRECKIYKNYEPLN